MLNVSNADCNEVHDGVVCWILQLLPTIPSCVQSHELVCQVAIGMFEDSVDVLSLLLISQSSEGSSSVSQLTVCSSHCVVCCV